MKSVRPFRPLAALAAFLALTLPAAAANRQELVFSFAFKEGALSYAPQQDGTLLPVLEGAELPGGNPGKPWLAVTDEAVKLPVGWKAVSVSATAERRLVREGIDVTPEQAPHPTNEGNPAWTPKDPAAYASDELWPGEAAELAAKDGGHGGMDFIMDLRWVWCLRNGLPLDMDVYDLASWSAVVPSTGESDRRGGAPVEILDFTRGGWKTAAPAAIGDVDLAALGLS